MTGYTRNDTADNIADGKVINASDLDGEFNAVQAAFHATTGHTHNGTTGGGAQIDYGDLANLPDLTNAAITGGTINGTTIGGTTAAAGSFTTLSASDAVTLSAGTANGVAYLNGSKVLTSGSALTFDGTSMTFADNSKAVFGAGSDLQIYHDGSNSYIKDAGTGNLIIQGQNLELQTASGEKFIRAVDNAEVSLYFNESAHPDPKLKTTTTGVDITGTATMDGLQVTNTATTGTNQEVASFRTASGGGLVIRSSDLSSANPDSIIEPFFDEDLIIRGNGNDRIKVDSSTGDISFYEDTGTTPKFFWDASAESLGIGTSSPNYTLDLVASSGKNPVKFWDFTQTAGLEIRQSATDSVLNASGDKMRFEVTGTERMRLTSTGLGIGTSSPTNALSVSGNANITGNTTLGDASTDTVTVNGTAAIGGTPGADIALRIDSSSLTSTGVRAVRVGYSIPATSTTNAISFFSIPALADSATTGTVYHFRADNATLGTGSSVTDQHGIYVNNLTSGTNNYGITSAVSIGTNKWNIYASGTAANYFAGNVGIGTTSQLANLTLSSSSNADGKSMISWRQTDTESIYNIFPIRGGAGFYLANGLKSSGSASNQFLSSYSTSTVKSLVGVDSNGVRAFVNAASADAVDSVVTPIERLRISTVEAVFNEPGNDYDFRVESDTNSHALFVDAGNNRVGLFNSAPQARLHIQSGQSSAGVTPVVRLDWGASSARNNFIGLNDADELVLGADETNIGTDSNVQFRVDAAEVARITPSYLRMAAGTGGIQFNGDTAAANALDDYEEGTWTPEFVDSAGANDCAASNVYNGAYYTKIGNLVTCSLRWNTTGGTAVNAYIDGLPFTPSNTSGKGINVSILFAGNLVTVGIGADEYRFDSVNRITLVGITLIQLPSIVRAEFSYFTD